MRILFRITSIITCFIVNSGPQIGSQQKFEIALHVFLLQNVYNLRDVKMGLIIKFVKCHSLVIIEIFYVWHITMDNGLLF